MNASPSIDSLTPREREILVLIAEGKSLQDIAKDFHRSLKTIESHRLSLGRKLKASNRVELAHIAIASGLVSVAGEQPSDSTSAKGFDPERELAILDEINRSLQNRSGRDYITTLCQTICRVLEIRYSAVCVAAGEQGADQRFVVAMSESGKALPSTYYSLSKSPVAEVLDRGAFCLNDGLAQAYADEPFFADNGLRSYFALRLDGNYGAETGVFAVVDDKPIEHPESVERILRFFLDRTSAELALLHQTEQIKMLKQQIKQSA